MVHEGKPNSAVSPPTTVMLPLVGSTLSSTRETAHPLLWQCNISRLGLAEGWVVGTRPTITFWGVAAVELRRRHRVNHVAPVRAASTLVATPASFMDAHDAFDLNRDAAGERRHADG